MTATKKAARSKSGEAKKAGARRRPHRHQGDREEGPRRQEGRRQEGFGRKDRSPRRPPAKKARQDVATRAQTRTELSPKRPRCGWRLEHRDRKDWAMASILLVVHPERPAAWELAKTATRWWQDQGREVIESDTASQRRPSPQRRGAGVRRQPRRGRDDAAHRRAGARRRGAGARGEPRPHGLSHRGRAVRHRAGLREDAGRRVLRRGAHGPRRASSPAAARGAFTALNDAIVERTEPGHTIQVAVDIAGRPFLTYTADGILVSTPTGSTAYNLSARGPVVSPGLRAMVLTPVSPHMLFDRSLVLEPAE